MSTRKIQGAGGEGPSKARAAQRSWPAAAALDSERSELVRKYMPLVGGQLKRLLTSRGLRVSRNHWNDLFQEGCLGLIRAALRYDAGAGIPFPVFALPRVHSAMRKAFLAVEERKATASEFSLCAAAAPCTEDASETAMAIKEAAAEQRCGRIAHAVRQAADLVDERWRKRDGSRERRTQEMVAATGATSPPQRPSRFSSGESNRLVETPHASEPSSAYEQEHNGQSVLRDLLVDRLLTGDTEYRRSLRRVVLATGVTYARVFAYARELRRTAGHLLAADPAVRARLRRDRLADIDAELRHDPLLGARRRVSREEKNAGKRLRQKRYVARRKARAAADPSVQIRKNRRKSRQKKGFRHF